MSKIDDLIKQYCPNGVVFKKLDELGNFYSGLSGKSKKDFENGNSKFITYVNIYKNPALDLNINETVFINDGEKQNKVCFGDVLFTGSSETPDECGFSSVITTPINENIYLNSFCFGFRFNDVSLFSPIFLKHLFRSDNLRKQIYKTASGVTRFNVSKAKFAKIVIPVPPLKVQEEIGSILDSFSKLQAELEAELEAELHARRQQYEHYRDRLLAFDNPERGGYIG